MRTPLVVSLAAGLALAAQLVAGQGKTIQAPLVPPTSRRLASDFELRDGNGQPVRLSDSRGSVVLLDFWATKCGGCVEEIPHLLELKSKYGDELVVVGLHVGDEEDRAKVPAFVDKLKITYPLAYPDSALTDFVFQTNSGIPQTAVFDRAGVMIRKIVGFNDEIQAKLDAAVERAIKSGIVD